MKSIAIIRATAPTSQKGRIDWRAGIWDLNDIHERHKHFGRSIALGVRISIFSPSLSGATRHGFVVTIMHGMFTTMRHSLLFIYMAP